MGLIRGLFLFLLLLAGAATAGAWYGVFDISARVPHWDITTGLIAAVRDRAITVHSRGLIVPVLLDPTLAARGGPLFHESCRPCHGAPGIPAEVFAQGLYPAPSDLLSGLIQKKWQDPQFYWIVENGMKMTGMPAFGATYNREELLGIAAFVKHLPGISPRDYLSQTAGSAGAGQKK